MFIELHVKGEERIINLNKIQMVYPESGLAVLEFYDESFIKVDEEFSIVREKIKEIQGGNL